MTLRQTILSTAVVVILAMIAGTLLESIEGSSFVEQHIYHAWWFIMLWAVLAVAGTVLILRSRMWKMPATLLLHMAFLVILCGALITHLHGEQGQLTLVQGKGQDRFVLKGGHTARLPFSIMLESFEVIYYEGTTSPQDYCSHLAIVQGTDTVRGTASMNRILGHQGYRFYQSGYDADLLATRLRVAHDPWGIRVSYTGYILLLLGMLLYFLQPQSMFRRLLREKSALLLLMLFLLPTSLSAQNTPRVVPTHLAEDLARLHIYYNGRICPVHTFAHDFTVKLFGKASYRGRRSEEVLAGWLFFPDTWKPEPMIRVKGSEVKQLLSVSSGYVSLLQFANHQGDYKLQSAVSLIQKGNDVAGKKNIMLAHEKVNIINGVFSGSAMKIFPLRQKDGSVRWYSSIDALPSDIDLNHWTMIRKQLPLIAEAITTRRYTDAQQLIRQLADYQAEECGKALPSALDTRAEILYNGISSSRLWAMLCTTIGILSFVYVIVALSRRKKPSRIYTLAVSLVMVMAWLFLTLCIVLRTLISHHLPLSNGFETMQALAWLSLAIAFLMRRRSLLALPFGCLIGGLAMMVAMMGESNPAVTHLMPVLQSPLLSMHVMVIMIAYSLLAFMMLQSVATLILMRHSPHLHQLLRDFRRISQLMLFPAVFLLTTGIFIGAVWANISWGRYWGWDSKEVWALITMLIYALPMHSSVSWLRSDKAYHTYIALAFLAVLMTYFGVNYFLPGMHSYA